MSGAQAVRTAALHSTRQKDGPRRERFNEQNRCWAADDGESNSKEARQMNGNWDYRDPGFSKFGVPPVGYNQVVPNCESTTCNQGVRKPQHVLI